MKIEYTLTFEEYLNAQLRLYELFGVYKQFMRRSYLAAAVVLLLFLVINIVPVYVSLIIALFGFLFVRIIAKPVLEKQIRANTIKIIGDVQEIESTVELTDEEIIFSKFGQATSFSLSTIKEIIETNEACELIFEPFSLAVLYKRVFESEEQFQQWITFIKNHS